ARMSFERRQDLLFPPAEEPVIRGADEEREPAEETLGGDERRLAGAIRRLGRDDAGLAALVGALPAWRRPSAHIVLIRELGAERAGAVAEPAFGGGAIAGRRFAAGEPARPGLGARWEYARARAAYHVAGRL